MITKLVLYQGNKAELFRSHQPRVLFGQQFHKLTPQVRFEARTEILFELFIIFWRCLGISKENQINEEIRDKEVRVISADGEQVGVMSAKEAIALAEKANLDLVKIAPNAVPPVCKIMDYGKFKFEQAKREKEAKKKQKVMDVKEVRLSLNIDTGDFNTKVNHALRFLKDGDKVKVSIRFRGREMAHTEYGTTIMQRFAEACSETGSVEKPAKLEGRQMLMFLVPKASK